MSEVRFLFVLLDVVPVRLSVHLPVYVSEFITRVVRPMLRKLDREPVIRALVHPRNETLYNQSGPHFHVVQSRYDYRIEVFEGLGRARHAEFRLRSLVWLRYQIAKVDFVNGRHCTKFTGRRPYGCMKDVNLHS